MKVSIIYELPEDFRTNGYVVTGTANWGFTPLWSVARQVYGFAADEKIIYSLKRANKNGFEILPELTPPLVLVGKTNDITQFKKLAGDLVTATQVLNSKNLIVTSFYGLKSKFNPILLECLLEEFSMKGFASHLDSVLFYIPQRENFLKAQQVLNGIHRRRS